MSTKHYPFYGGSFDRIIFDGDGSVWVPESENAKLRELVRFANKTVEGLCGLVENSPGCYMCPLNQDEDRACGAAELFSRMRELGVDE